MSSLKSHNEKIDANFDDDDDDDDDDSPERLEVEAFLTLWWLGIANTVSVKKEMKKSLLHIAQERGEVRSFFAR